MNLNTKLTTIPELHYHTEAVLCNNFAAGCRSSLKLYNILNGAKSSKLREILALYEIVEMLGNCVQESKTRKVIAEPSWQSGLETKQSDMLCDAIGEQE